MGLMTSAWTDNSIATRWRHAHQSWVHVMPPTDTISVITIAPAAYDLLCDNYSKHIVHGAPMTRNKHCDCPPLLNHVIHILLRYDI